MDQKSFWQGDDLLCLRDGQLGFQYFPTLTISLAASANETIRLILSPKQYLRFDKEWYDEQTRFGPDYKCYRVSISPSESGMYLC